MTHPHPHPRVALVLGSGGVRSVAAVAIAEELARAGLGPDLVVGCSSGALFGATIAAQMPAQEALARARTLWSSELTGRRRWRAYAQMMAPRLLGFPRDFSLRDDRLIAQRLAQAFGTRRIEQLPVPLRVAVTEAASGAPTLLDEGPLVDALRASMAVPFLFPSVELGGRRLVDGVISDPLPIGAALDAQVIVTLGFRGSMPRRVDRASRLLAQVSTALTNNLQQARLAAAQAAGQRIVGLELVLQRPVGLWETEALRDCFEAGRQAARRALPQIRAELARASHAEPRPTRTRH